MRAKIVFGVRGIKEYYIDGKPVTKKEFDHEMPGQGKDALNSGTVANTILSSSHKAWPRKSDAMGVHPSQAKEAEADSIKRGVPTEFDKETGQAVLRSSAHQRDLQKALGYHNRDGGYGQVTG